MKDQLQYRLETLHSDFATGQARLQELERQQIHLRETLLRISGAIQVLEEVLAALPSEPQNGVVSSEEITLSSVSAH